MGGGPGARRPGTETGDTSSVNNRSHGPKNQSATEGEGPTSISECREGTGMGTETPGSRGFEQGQIGCGQELRREGQNQARGRTVNGKLSRTRAHLLLLLNHFLPRAILSYFMLCCTIPFHSIIAFYYNCEILITQNGQISNFTG